MGADLIMMGATRRLFTEQAWTSISVRVMEKTQCPLILVPGSRNEDTGEIPRIAVDSFGFEAFGLESLG